MEKGLYLKILRYLKKSGVNHQVNIFKVFKKSHITGERIEEVFQLRPEYINHFLQKMKDDGYIEFIPAKAGSVYETSWETPFEIKASITHKGYAYVSEQDNISFTKGVATIALIISLYAPLKGIYDSFSDKKYEVEYPVSVQKRQKVSKESFSNPRPTISQTPHISDTTTTLKKPPSVSNSVRKTN